MTRAASLQIVALIVILLVGCFYRLHTTIGFRQVGYDEDVYRVYVNATAKVGGISHYTDVVDAFESYQASVHDAIANPLRVFYIFTSYFFMIAAHCDAMNALYAVSKMFSVLLLVVSGLFAWRAAGRGAALGVMAIMAVEPIQLLLAQRALVDGVYTFWAVTTFWLLWENLRNPNSQRWLAAYGASFFLMVLTKETAAFVAFSLCGVIVLNKWLHIGKVTPRLLAWTVAAPTLAVVVLVFYAGGFGPFIHFYEDFVQKSRTLHYAMVCQDGPWTRYLFDFLMITPLVLLLAVGKVFQLRDENRADLYCAVFLALCYVPMSSVKYGLSVRFAAFWDLPLCYLAYSQLSVLAERIVPSRKIIALVACTLLMCFTGLLQYYRIFVEMPVYDPVTRNVLHALYIYK